MASPPPHFTLIFCSPQALARFFRSLVRSPPGKGKETAATLARILFNFFTDDGEVSAPSMSYTHPLFSSHGYQMVNSYHNITDEKLYKVLIRQIQENL